MEFKRMRISVQTASFRCAAHAYKPIRQREEKKNSFMAFMD